MTVILQRHVMQVLTLLLGVGLLRFVGILPPIYVGQIIDALTASNTATGLWLVGVIGGLALTRTLVSPFVTRWVTGFVQDVVKEQSISWVRVLLDKDFRFFRDASLGGLLRSTDRGLTAYEVYLTYIIVQVIPNILELFIIGIYLAIVAGPLILAMLIVMAGLLALLTIQGVRWRRPYIDAVNEAEDDISGNLAEVIEAGSSLKIMRAKEDATRFLGRAFEDYRSHAVRLSFASEVVSSLQALLAAGATVTTLLYGIIVVSKGSTGTTVGDFVVIFSFTGIFMMNAQRLAEAYRQTDQFRADKSAFDEVLCYPSFRQAGSPPPSFGDLQVLPFRREVAPGTRLVVRNKLYVPSGGSLAIYGETGGGKTSLLRTLGGIETPEGKVFVDGVDITLLAEDDLFKTIYIDQQTSVFPEGDPAWSLFFRFGGEIEPTVLQLAWELKVGHLLEKGKSISPKTLSGGEKRRLALLRALVSRTPILFLDEPSESLDSETATLVWDIIFREKQGRTIVCVTHDNNALPRFDAILKVDKGRVSLPSPPTMLHKRIS